MPQVRVWLTAALTAALYGFGIGSEVSRTPPSVYAEHIAPQLTPLEEVLAGRSAFPEDKTGGIVLLSERIDYRADDGTAYRAIHAAYHTVDQSAVESMGTDVFSYDRMREDIFLVEAVTISADGRRQPVESKGAFIQTPQYEARNSLYTSEAELRVIYPNVAPGSTTEVIVIVRENTPVMPGEYATSMTFGSSWPLYRMRRVLDFPADYLARVHASTSGGSVPEAQTTAYAPGRDRRIWESKSVPAVAWEENGPEWEFRSPTLWLTTLDSWDEMAAWYDGLVADRSELGAELEAQVDMWTAGLDRRGIIDKLTATVANDVRYAGLEFGLAGFQPHPCREVWDKRYGDCKDKSNLLRAMLAHKGVTAHLVFVETRGMGRIERASPSWQQFNHAILAVENEEGQGYLFCDPTIAHLPAGTIGLRDRGRDLLIVKHGRAEWAQAADQLDSALRLNADLALGSDGSLSGWLTIATEGTDAALYADYYNGQDPDERRRSLQRYLDGLFPGGEVMDIDYTPVNGAVTSSRIRAYFVRAPRGGSELPFVLPYPKHWLPNVDTAGTRRFPYITTHHEESVAVTITLPPNWSARALPAAFSAPSEVAQIDASWSIGDGRLTARLAWHPKRSALAPTEYAVFQRSIRALAAWLDQPAVLVPSTTAFATVAQSDGGAHEPLPDFPILPTGAGQLRLLEERFPGDKSDVPRIAALQRVMQWFPNDNETMFEAQSKIAIHEWERDRLTDAEFADRMAGLLSRYGSLVTAEDRAWGDYLEAKARWGATKDPTAITRLRQLAEDPALSAYRRGWSAEGAGRFLGESDIDAAVAFLRQHDDYESEARPTIVRHIARLLALEGRVDLFRAWLDEIGREHAEAADALFVEVVSQLSNSDSTTTGVTRVAFLAILDGIISDASAFPRSHPRLAGLRATIELDQARAEFRRELTTWLEANPPAWWTREKSSELPDLTAVTKRLEDRNDSHDPEGTVDAALQLILHHETTFEDFAQYTRWALWWLHNRHFHDALLDTLGRATLRLPFAADQEVGDCWNIYALWLAESGRLDEARAIRRRVLEAPDAKDFQRVEAGGELGLLEFRAGNREAALTAIAAIESLHRTYKWTANFLYPAILLHLEHDEYDAALAKIELIRAEEKEYVDKTEYATVLPHLLRAAENPAALKAYWEHRRKWRPHWDMILTTQKTPRTSALPLTLAVEPTALTERITDATKRKDLAAYLRALDDMALTAQWVPMYASNFARAISDSNAFPGLMRRSLYELGLLALSELPVVDPEFDFSGRLWEIALLTDLPRTKLAATRARQLAVDAGSKHKLGQTALRLWSLNARGTQEAIEANQALAEALASPHAFFERWQGVEILADSYQAAGDTAAERGLLERETKRPDFNNTTTLGRKLQSRLAQLHGAADSTVALTRAINGWCKHHDLAWLNEIAPRALDDPRFAALKPPLLQKAQGFSTAETIKLNFLFALDERQTLDARAEAWFAAATDLAFDEDDRDRFTAVLFDVAQPAFVPNEWRARALVMGARVAAARGDETLFARIATHPGFNVIAQSVRDDFDRAKRALAAFQSETSGDKEVVSILAEKPLERLTLALAEHIFRQLAWRGEDARAAEFIAAAKDLAIHPSQSKSTAALRLEWTRLARTIREQRPLWAAVRARLEQLPEAKAPPTSRVLNLLWFHHAEQLTDAERVQLVLHTLATGHNLPEYTSPLLHVLFDATSVTLREPMLPADLLEIVLQIGSPDAARAPFIGVTSLECDEDVPAVRARVTTLLEGFLRSPAATTQPQTRREVAFTLALQALRASHDARPADLFDPARTNELTPATLQRLQLQFLHSRGQQEEALRLVETLDTETLTWPSVFDVARTVLQQAGRIDEITLLDESMRDALARRLPELWMDPDGNYHPSLAEAMIALEARELLPAAWFERAIARLGTDVQKHALRVDQATLAQDWPALLAAADAELTAGPRNYNYHYDRARARHHLGDLAGERDDLRVFLQFALNSTHYPEAQARLRELESAGVGKSTP